MEDAEGSRLTRARLPEGMAGVARFHELVAGLADEPSEVVVATETDRGRFGGKSSIEGLRSGRRTGDRGPGRPPGEPLLLPLGAGSAIEPNQDGDDAASSDRSFALASDVGDPA